MSEAAAVSGEQGHGEGPGTDRARLRLARRAMLFVTVVLLAHLPLLLLHLGDLWQFRPHYRWYPVLLVGVGWLFWRRQRLQEHDRRPKGSAHSPAARASAG